MRRLLTARYSQVAATRAVVEWYLNTYHCTPEDAGTPLNFCSPRHVGHFACDRAGLEAGDGRQLFKLLVATAMFQRRQDVQILRILRGIGSADSRELSSQRRLLTLADRNSCPHSRDLEALITRCDLRKDAGEGTCGTRPNTACYLKRHTELLKRYGHFGKVPTSIALMLRDVGAADLPSLRAATFSTFSDPQDRAATLEQLLSRAWRVNQKIACMFLSAVAVPDLSPVAPPWTKGVDWTWFVVVDSNVDLFLASIGYNGAGTYDARRNFLRSLAGRIDLSALRPHLKPYNPRLVQQAVYLFMSAANRRATTRDCSKQGAERCARCPAELASRCPLARREA